MFDVSQILVVCLIVILAEKEIITHLLLHLLCALAQLVGNLDPLRDKLTLTLKLGVVLDSF